jgi:hypothetical protein
VTSRSDRETSGRRSDEAAGGAGRAGDHAEGPYAAAMNVVVRPGSRAEQKCRWRAGLDGREIAETGALAGGLRPRPDHDLIFRGGKLIPDLTFANFFVGGEDAWDPDDRRNIDDKLAAAMSDRRLNDVLLQYFSGRPISSTFRGSRFLPGPPPQLVSQGDIEQLVRDIQAHGLLNGFDLASTVFNFMLPERTVLTTDEAPSGQTVRSEGWGETQRTAATSAPRAPAGDQGETEEKASSLEGLGGFHGSVHVGRDTIYYAVGVFSNGDNGIVAFDEPWKNVVATFYHELCEARTDPDVEDANKTGNSRLIGFTSRQGEEIGDFPVFEVGNRLDLVFKELPLADGSGTVPVQLEFSNRVHGPEDPTR